MSETAAATEIDDILVTSTPAPSREIEDPVLLVRFVEDLAQAIYPKDLVANRYGFLSVQDMRNYLRTHPELVARIQRHRAIHHSDGNAQERVKLQACVAIGEQMHHVAAMLSDKSLGPSVRIDALKSMIDMSGVKSVSSAARGEDTRAPQGARFSVTINLPNATEKITTVVGIVPDAEIVYDEEPPALDAP